MCTLVRETKERKNERTARRSIDHPSVRGCVRTEDRCACVGRCVHTCVTRRREGPASETDSERATETDRLSVSISQHAFIDGSRCFLRPRADVSLATYVQSVTNERNRYRPTDLARSLRVLRSVPPSVGRCRRVLRFVRNGLPSVRSFPADVVGRLRACVGGGVAPVWLVCRSRYLYI